MSIARKDPLPPRSGSGVAILCRKDWKVKITDSRNRFECLWCTIETPNRLFYTVAVYNPPDPSYDTNEFLDYLSNCCDLILLKDTNAKLIIAGNINQLDTRDFVTQHAFKQLVTNATRGVNTLNVFFTNRPLLWDTPTVFPSSVRSDHLAVFVPPRVTIKPVRRIVYFRDVQEHHKIKMDKELQHMNWSGILSSDDLNL